MVSSAIESRNIARDKQSKALFASAQGLPPSYGVYFSGLKLRQAQALVPKLLAQYHNELKTLQNQSTPTNTQINSTKQIPHVMGRPPPLPGSRIFPDTWQRTDSQRRQDMNRKVESFQALPPGDVQKSVNAGTALLLGLLALGVIILW